MSSWEIVVELVRALAWPVAVIAVALLVRRIVSEQLTEVEWSGFRAKFQRLKGEANRSADNASSSADASDEADPADDSPGLSQGMYADAEKDPSGSILAAHERVMESLRQRLVSSKIEAPPAASGTRLSRLAKDHGIIDAATADAVQTMVELRNQVAHGHKRVSAADAVDYVSAADNILYSMSRPTGRSTTRFSVMRDGAVVDRRMPASGAFRVIAADVAREVGVDRILETVGSPRLAQRPELVTRPERARRVAPEMDLWHTTQLNQVDYSVMATSLAALSVHAFTMMPERDP